MTSQRAAPFASKPPEGWDVHVEAMRATRMFLLQKMGPTRFVVRGEDSDRKFTVLVGSTVRCSCGILLCLHHLFVMLKVLKVPQTNPLAWQTALIDSEVDSILALCGNKEGGHVDVLPCGQGPARAGRHEFLRRGSGRGCAGGSASGASGVEGCGDQGRETRKLSVVAGDVCPVCQEEMEVNGEVIDTTARAGSLTYCRDGCGNNMHARCMLMYAEHRRSTGDTPCCPFCRVHWGAASLKALKEEARNLKNGRLGGRSNDFTGVRLRGGGVLSGPNVRLVPVTCRSCKLKVQAAFFRCLVCTPPGSWDLCRRCYAASGVRSGNGPCNPAGGRRHMFVQGEAAAYPPEWRPAEMPDKGRRPGRHTPEAAVLSLQGREITINDFELLLTLETSLTPPLHEHLLRALPASVSEEHGKVDGHGALPPTFPSATGLSRARGLPEDPQNALHHGAPAGETLLLQNRPGLSAPCAEACSGTGGEGGEGGENAHGDLVSPLTPAEWIIPTTDFQAEGTTSADAVQLSFPGCYPPENKGRMLAASGGMICCCCSRSDVCSNTEQFSAPGRQLYDSPTFRRLPCGHSAHDACLIPILLEGAGEGDPSSCACPVDGVLMFPTLSRHRCRRRKLSLGDSAGDSGEAMVQQQQGRGGSAPPAQTGAQRAITKSGHPRTTTEGKALRRNSGVGSGGGRGDVDILDIALVGSGIVPATPSSIAKTRSSTIYEGLREIRMVSASKSQPPRKESENSTAAIGDFGKNGENAEGGEKNSRRSSTGTLVRTQSVRRQRILESHDTMVGFGSICISGRSARSFSERRQPRRAAGISLGTSTGVRGGDWSGRRSRVDITQGTNPQDGETLSHCQQDWPHADN